MPVTIREITHTSIKKITWEWTSDASGDAGGASDGGTTALAYTGEILRLVTVPSSTAAPSDDYDVVITDDDGVDVLMGAGADRDEANTEQVLGSSLGVVAASKLTLIVENAGNAKQGTVHLYLR